MTTMSLKGLFSALWTIPFLAVVAGAQTNYEKATFAGGCFWCVQPPFEKLTGVVEVVAGYAGGTGANPTYEDYAEKGYVEAVQVTYDPSKITYEQLLNVFWRQIDPTDAGGQFVDRGPQYRSAVFYPSDEQKQLAEKSKQELAKSGRFDKPIVTEITQGLNLLQGRGLSPGLLQEEPDPVQVLPVSRGPRPVPGKDLGPAASPRIRRQARRITRTTGSPARKNSRRS